MMIAGVFKYFAYFLALVNGSVADSAALIATERPAVKGIGVGEASVAVWLLFRRSVRGPRRGTALGRDLRSRVNAKSEAASLEQSTEHRSVAKWMGYIALMPIRSMRWRRPSDCL